MQPPLHIRGLVEDDLPSVAVLESDAHVNPWSPQYFASLLASSASGLLGTLDSRPVCYLVYYQMADEAELLNLVCDTGYHNRGYARQLLQHWFAMLGHETRRIFLEVASDNLAALAVYRKLAFSEYGRRKSYYNRPEGRCDAILMEKSSETGD